MKNILAGEAISLMQSNLLHLGMDVDDARFISETLVDSSLRGIDTHGIRLFNYYLLELRHGRANLHPKMQVDERLLATATIDADNANGLIAGKKGMEVAIEKANRLGIGMTVVKNSNHFGAAGSFTRLASAAGLIGISMSNSDALVSFQGSTEPFLGTNPIAFSIPTQDIPFELDLATSQVAYSKIKTYLKNNIPLESGWGIDELGQDSEISNKVRALQPLGGYKGQALGMMVQMLTCVLSGGLFDNQISHLYTEPYDKPRKISHSFIAINPKAFMDETEFINRVSALLESAKKVAPEVILPGQKEKESMLIRIKEGLPLSDEDALLFTEMKKRFSQN